MLFHVSFWARVSYVTTRVTRATCLLHVLANSDCIRLESFHQTKNQIGNEPMLIISISSMLLYFFSYDFTPTIRLATAANVDTCIKTHRIKSFFYWFYISF